MKHCENNRNDPHFGIGKANPDYRANNEKWCAMVHSYIRQRWGY